MVFNTVVNSVASVSYSKRMIKRCLDGAKDDPVGAGGVRMQRESHGEQCERGKDTR